MPYHLRSSKLLVFAIIQTTLCLITFNPAAAAQQNVTTTPAEPAPIECWWRTSAGAIRVGQVFDVVLTCSLMDTPTTKAVPDESSLDPNGIQLDPFEVMGGNRSADSPSTDHRFFQYVYRLRLNSPDFFGKDVKLPEKKITYRVQRRSGNAPAVEGIEQTYVLPKLSLHVLSLVAADANDIRDAPSITFADLDSRSFRSNILKSIVVVLGIAALFLFVLAISRFVGSRSPSRNLRQLVPDCAVLQTVMNELEAIAQEQRRNGQTDALSTRLLTVLRILSAYALDIATVPLLQWKNSDRDEGYLPVQYRPRYPFNPFARPVHALVPASITPATIATHKIRFSSNLERTKMLEELERGISGLSASHYSPAETIIKDDFDASLNAGIRAAHRLRAERHWLTLAVKRLREISGFSGKK